MKPDNYIFQNKIDLGDGQSIELSYLNLEAYQNIFQSVQWEISQWLSDEYDSNIYLNETGNVLDQCIYGPKGVMFKDEATYVRFKSKWNVIYFKSHDRIIISETIIERDFDGLFGNRNLKKIKTQFSDDLFLVTNTGKVIEYRKGDKQGSMYDDLDDFNSMVKEYAIGDIIIGIPETELLIYPTTKKNSIVEKIKLMWSKIALKNK